ncbi:MAG: UDP-N-acetylmuramoyl-L-alanine--D-glutamate ligase [Porticoccaceae bacterium]|nr:UDP-N-acetylmuramoyl-L-alanine--D-glutamate ligase [Porticoccaceae bacterium]
MTTKLQTTEHGLTAILGIGVTGLSVARFLARRQREFVVCDTREQPPLLAQFKEEFSGVPYFLGSDAEQVLRQADELVVSPGLAQNEPLLVAARQRGINVIGDIELFARHAKAPVAAITGSNGKSTVTTLLGEMARAAGRKVAVGGNLGTPALELLDDDCELYVLELSSFQLEITDSLKAAVACILNLSEDHLDRYGSMASYLAAKQRIFHGAGHIVCNRDDSATRPIGSAAHISSFGLQLSERTLSDVHQCGIANRDGKLWLHGASGDLMSVDELRIKGRHNWANALAAMAMAAVLELPEAAMMEAMRQFPGLNHRCQTVRTLDGVSYINDSKATNVGATLAALEGLGAGERRNIIWIAGGDGKGAEFHELRSAVAASVKQALLIGVDGPRISEAIAGATEIEPCETLQAAVARARHLAQPGDLVLLSPACASFDMFDNFEHRGDVFAMAAEGLS